MRCGQPTEGGQGALGRDSRLQHKQVTPALGEAGMEIHLEEQVQQHHGFQGVAADGEALAC